MLSDIIKDLLLVFCNTTLLIFIIFFVSNPAHDVDPLIWSKLYNYYANWQGISKGVLFRISIKFKKYTFAHACQEINNDMGLRFEEQRLCYVR